jgi:predicted phosphodiesterase
MVLQMIIGVISDTHGLLRPEAVALLRGSEHIIHAGDIGSPEIIPALEKIAPVTAISTRKCGHGAFTRVKSWS